jgi:hypothetical protein
MSVDTEIYMCDKLKNVSEFDKINIENTESTVSPWRS